MRYTRALLFSPLTTGQAADLFAPLHLVLPTPTRVSDAAHPGRPSFEFTL